jgi:hypothetical protein
MRLGCEKEISDHRMVVGRIYQSLKTLLRGRYGSAQEVSPWKKSHHVWPKLLSPVKSLYPLSVCLMNTYSSLIRADVEVFKLKAVREYSGSYFPGEYISAA